MIEQTQKINKTLTNVFPRSVLSVSREEFGWKQDNPDAKYPPLNLNVKDGNLPLDLQGHLFIVGPVGSVDSDESLSATGNPIVLPSNDGMTPLYNGDGMVYRLDFDNLDRGVFLSTRILKTPCYYADVATNKCKKYQGDPNNKNTADLRFKNLGIARISEELGSRNQLNTAFLPIKFDRDEAERLLVTWDAGRPYEIDPKTLAIATPVGRNAEWREVSPYHKLLGKPPSPFKVVQTTAHPCFDSYQNSGEMFTINCGRSLLNILSPILPFANAVNKILDWRKKLFQPSVSVRDPRNNPRQKNLFDRLLNKLKKAIDFVNFIFGVLADDFVYLMRWDGAGKLEKWPVMYNGFPIEIQQSVHQIGITEDYILIMDTAFKISLEELLPSLSNKEYKKLERSLREIIDRPQLRNTSLYIVRRSDLQPGKAFVNAKKVVIPREAAHFLTDYKNPSGQITIHLSHVSGWDAAEWISEFDFADNDDSPDAASNNLQKLYGVIFGPTDISSLGCYVIDGETGELLKEDRVSHKDYTWGPALYAYRDNPPNRIEDIYWNCVGCWDELLMPHIINMYRDYEYRQFNIEVIETLAKKGKPASLLRVHIAPLESLHPDDKRLTIADVYQFPASYTVGSPQFVPRSDNSNSTDGYIICVVFYGDGKEETNGNEIWIFDAADLKSGPKCKLWHPQLNFGFTVHTTWLKKIEPRTASYYIPVREDYQKIIKQQPKEIQDLFENWVYASRE